MHIVIGCGGMAFGPHTPELASLGGSETSALMLAKALAARGDEVHMFCNLPAPTAPDAFQGGLADDGVFYQPVNQFGRYVDATQHDLTIGVRDPAFMTVVANSKKKVLWAHDIFTKRGMGKALEQIGFCFDEIWSVSEWHRQQIHEATGYPLENIVALRNGIVDHNTVGQRRQPYELLYAARPERGLDNLIRPGGIMDNLPEFHLSVAMYEHFPEHMRGYYEQIMRRMSEMPNVTFIGGKSNVDLRRIIGSVEAYIYPTQFEETSCILARECVEQQTPFLTTRVGALPETLGASGVYFDSDLEVGSPAWCKAFAEWFRKKLRDDDGWVCGAVQDMAGRHDLYWDGVAEMVVQHAEPKLQPKQSVGAALIAYNNEDTILRCLNSLVGNVDSIHIALGPSTDNTAAIIDAFAAKHADIPVRVIPVPKIEPWLFGFDDARNASVQGIHDDWILWIDTDEYLVGNIRKYLRNNHLQSYMISQHHFTVEPKGAPTQIDRPARLFRNYIGFVAKGHIHEHFELPEGGPGRAYLIEDVDIGHTGYVNEDVRQARFRRNWPFLEWEHAEGSDRKINHFLWFRDIVHRMRFAVQQHDIDGASKLALEGEQYYNAHYEDMGVFGPGLYQSLIYLGEVYSVLGKGVPVKIMLAMDDRQTQLEGKFTSYDQVERVMKQILEPEFKDRGSKYYG